MDDETLGQVRQDILEGKISLRSAAKKYNIDRDRLKMMIEGQITEETESNRFRERMKLNYSSSKLPLDEQMKSMVIDILKGEITAKQASQKYHIDGETIRRKIEDLVQTDSQYLKMYLKYREKSAIDYGKFNFRGLIIHMLKNNMSQSQISMEYDIPARTISREIEKLQESEDERDIQLYNIAKICADKKMKRQELSSYEIDLYNRILTTLFPNESIILFESPTDVEKRRLEKFLEQVNIYQTQGMTAEQVAQEMETSISTIRRNKLKLEELQRQEKYKQQIAETEEKEVE